MSGRSVATFVVVAAAACLIAGCGGSAHVGGATANSATRSPATARTRPSLDSSSPPATSASAPRHTRHNFVGVSTVQDDMGYRYRFEYDLNATFKATKSIEYDVPRQASIEQPITAQVYITSALTGRQAGRVEPLSFTAVSIDGLFKTSRPICRAVGANNPEGVQVEKLTRPAGSYCDIPFATAVITQQPPTIALYQQITLRMLGLPPSDPNIAPSANETYIDALPESRFAAARRDFAQGPDLWAVEANDPNGLDDWSHAACSIPESAGIEVFAASWPTQIHC